VRVAIDNVYDAIDKQYPKGDAIASGIMKVLDGAKALGKVSPPIYGFFAFLNSMSAKARQERAEAFVSQLVEDMVKVQDAMEKMRTDIGEVQAATRLALEYDTEEFDDKKRNRYIWAITGSITSETRVNDLVSFIQDIEKLGERDLIGLKVLNRIMNKDGDWQEQAAPPQTNPPKLHPNTFRFRAQELSLQMAQALTGKTDQDANTFSREEGLQICLRLEGFGLAEVIEISPREVPISNYCARLTTRGLMLLDLLGEPVPNWRYYFGPDGAL
jgi:hypothetical protein